jgi:hypothetical protein
MRGEAVDEKWFNHFSEIRVRYDKLVTPDPFSFSKDADELFNFSYSHLQEADFSTIKAKLASLRSLVESEKTISLPAYTLWIKKIEEVEGQINLLDTLRTSLYGQNETDANVQDLIMSVIARPDEDILALTLAELYDRLLAENKVEVLNQLGFADNLAANGQYSSLAKNFPFVFVSAPDFTDKSQLNIESLKTAFDEVLKQKGLYGIWKVKIDETGKYKRVSVFYQNQVIMLPSRYLDFEKKVEVTISHKKLLRLIAHELDTHVERSSNGLSSRLKLLSVGLDSYVAAEEGLATYREQKVLGTGKYFAGFYPYLSVCLALGLDREGAVRTPHELFNLLKTIFSALNHLDDQKATYEAIKRVMRTYIGFRGKYIINTKDLNYRAGNIKIHKLMYEDKTGDDVLNVGIYDPTNKIHLEMLKQLEVLN